MRLSTEEMNILATYLEKEESRLHEQYAQSGDSANNLAIISQLQRKFRNLEADLTNEEKQFLSQLLQNELSHIHGHEPEVYHSLMSKID